MNIISKLFNFFRLFGKIRHKIRIKNAKKVSKKLLEIKNNNNNYKAISFVYIRKINPFVFEELILSSIEKQGKIIKRNKSYSNDGGLDGIFYDKKYGKVLIQSKRYKSYISKKHVEEFLDIVKKNNYKGIFVHTGKTGKYTKLLEDENVCFISGENLIDLINNDKNIDSILNKKFGDKTWK